VQHISPGFVEGFARWLDGEVPLSVRIAVPGARPAPGIWIAPEGAHLILNGQGWIALDQTTVAGMHCPSGDVLLGSLAASAGSDAVAVVLTGMGRDGAEGLGDVNRAGGLTIAQDEATCVVYGMPKSAADLRAACQILPLPLIPEAVLERIRQIQRTAPGPNAPSSARDNRS